MASAATIVKGALQAIGVLAESETPGAGQLDDGYRRLNMMLSGWRLHQRTFIITEREVFDILTDKGSTSDPYLVGPGGDLETTPRPAAILGAAILSRSTTPYSERPIAVYNYQQYANIAIKALTGSTTTALHYQPASPVGKLYLYPVLDDATDQLVLYIQKPLITFETKMADYDLPDGAEEAIESNLAVRLSSVYTVPVPPEVAALAKSSLAVLKRSTYQLVDLESPFTRGGLYDINSDTVQ